MNKIQDTLIEKVALLCLLALVATLTFVKVWESDAWWHLKAGELIAESATREAGAGTSLPAYDAFSHTKSGERWINDEWMGDYYLYAAYSKNGLRGLQILVCLLSAFMFFALYHAGRRAGADPLLLLPLLAVAAFAARARLTPRPELFSLLFVVSFFYLISRILAGGAGAANESGEEKAGARTDARRITIIGILFPVLQALWVNFHPGASLGLVFLFCAIVASACAFVVNLKTGASLKPEITAREMRRLGLIFIACTLAMTMNPYGLHGLTAPLEFAGNAVFLKHIAEWVPVPPGEWFVLKGGAPGAAALPFFLGLGAISFAVNRRRLNLFHLLIFLLTAYMALSARRFIGAFALLAAPIVAVGLTPLIAAPLRGAGARAATALALIVAFGVAGYAGGINGDRFAWGEGVNERFYPAHAIQFIKDNEFAGNMYNTYGLGGPLIHGLYPEHKVFIDGRATFYGADAYAEVIEFEKAPTSEKWNQLQEKYDLAFAVLRSDRPATGQAILGGKGPWALVYWDAFALIYAKDTPEHASLIERCAYRVADAYVALDRAHKWKKLDDGTRALLRAELERSLSLSPENMPALRALTYIYFLEKEDELALKTAKQGIEIDDSIAGLHAVAGEIYLRNGRRKDALDSFRKAAAIRPEYADVVERVEGGATQ